MKDIIIGRVTKVIDLETIDVEVTQIVRNRHHRYNPKEKIRFKSLQNKLETFKKIRTKRFVEAMLIGKGVMCLVIGRDPQGCIEADVYALGQ